MFGKFLSTNMGNCSIKNHLRVEIEPLDDTGIGGGDVTAANFLTPLFGILTDDSEALFLVSFAEKQKQDQVIFESKKRKKKSS